MPLAITGFSLFLTGLLKFLFRLRFIPTSSLTLLATGANDGEPEENTNHSRQAMEMLAAKNGLNPDHFRVLSVLFLSLILFGAPSGIVQLLLYHMVYDAKEGRYLEMVNINQHIVAWQVAFTLVCLKPLADVMLVFFASRRYLRASVRV